MTEQAAYATSTTKMPKLFSIKFTVQLFVALVFIKQLLKILYAWLHRRQTMLPHLLFVMPAVV